MYTVTMVTMKSKVTFAVLNITFVDHSRPCDVNFQNRNTLENCRSIRPQNVRQYEERCIMGKLQCRQ